MVTLDTLQFNFAESIGLPDRNPLYNKIEPALGRFLKTITDPIEDVLPTLKPLHHPLSSNQYRNQSALYRTAFMSAQQARANGKSCLLDFPTRVEFWNIHLKSGLFQSILPHLSHIRVLKLSDLTSGIYSLAHILSQCPNLNTCMIDSSSYSYGLSFTFDESAPSIPSQSTSTVVHPQQYPRLFHFSATVSGVAQQTVASLLRALPSLTYFKMCVTSSRDFYLPSMDLSFLYKHAAEHCPQLAHVHITQATGVAADHPQEIALVQQFFPRTTYLRIHMNYTRSSWLPDLSTFMFFSQMTHLEMSHAFSYGYRFKFSLDLVLRSAPRLLSIHAPQEELHMYEGGSLEYSYTRYDYNGREIKSYRQSRAVRRQERLARRIAKQVDRDHLRELPHPSLWLCQGLRTADLKVRASPELLQYIVRQCPQLVNLTMRMNRLGMGQMGSERKYSYLHKRAALYAKNTRRGVVMKSGGYAIEYCQSAVQHGDEVRVLAGLERLERLVLHIGEIPGVLTMQCFEWMGERAVVPPSGLRRRGNTTIFREAYKYLPRMEQFVLHHPQQLGVNNTSLWKQVRENRLSIEFLFYYASQY
ncbi:hypothetical protein BG005_003315 [Podila minutissima]|nr:hypothetical protein BG005_003315 [Podila minutissima]